MRGTSTTVACACVLAVITLAVPAFAGCGFGTPCSNGNCCSEWGYCGKTDGHCGSSCVCDCPNGPPCEQQPQPETCGFSLNRNDNVVLYWGQTAEQSLRAYCDVPQYDAIILAFMNNFPTSGTYSYPTLNLGSKCLTKFSDWTGLIHCPSIAADINYCQSKGKVIMLSLGGGVGTYQFASAAEATSFAGTIWNMFLGGSSSHRPFDATVLEGIDLDIEQGSYLYYADFAVELRRLMNTDLSRNYYISAAPQCPFGDKMLGPDGLTWDGKTRTHTALTDGPIDFFHVQFYNNPPCNLGTSGYLSGPNSFQRWAQWAASENPAMRVLVGAAPAVQSLSTTKDSVQRVMSYGNMGGVMLWAAGTSGTASTAYGVQLGTFIKSFSPCSDDADQCPDDPNKTQPGTCGCGKLDTPNCLTCDQITSNCLATFKTCSNALTAVSGVCACMNAYESCIPSMCTNPFQGC
eukprot:TRINITY_DN9177_c0_g1_i1.p1 TRINITY_DN9177_c0_g1~~TRINITY_DN9177_c0_g1_i1.p1  ORF type:complete len:461 (-),score=107.84 TRINITY_DN9177_c0_g1_i1:71-1453(-)